MDLYAKETHLGWNLADDDFAAFVCTKLAELAALQKENEKEK